MHSVYVHIPLCRKKCPYCDFVSFAKSQFNEEQYLKLLLEELNLRHKELGAGLTTIYFGGGTPSLLKPDFFSYFLSELGNLTSFSADIEISIEANPESISGENLSRLKNAGINRVSLGVQSFNDSELITLGRLHDSEKAWDTIGEARAAGFSGLSIDLIFGIPGQTMATWRSTLDRAVSSPIDHLSLYPLTISSDCSWKKETNGDLPDDDIVADMYGLACKSLESKGFLQYEISNFAQTGSECAHNLNYWECGDYLGVGAGAHSKIDDRRSWNTPRLDLYTQQILCGELPIEGAEVLDSETMTAEKLILNLRLNKGLDLLELEETSGSNELTRLLPKLKEMKNLGLIDMNSDNIRLTNKGRFIANEVFVELLPG